MYCTYIDLVERFGSIEITQLTELPGPCPATDKAIMDSAAEIDAYLAVRHDLPLTSIPPVINRCACELARYYLWDDKTTEHVRQRYEDAVAILKGISSGSIKLAYSSEAAPTTSKSDVKFAPSSTITGWLR